MRSPRHLIRSEAAWSFAGAIAGSCRSERIMIESGDARQPFHYAVGLYGSKFFQELRDHRKFIGIKCPICQKVYVPPRRGCDECFVEMNEFVEVGPNGRIGTFSILRYAVIDPETGEPKPVRYGYGFIQLDGAGRNLTENVMVNKFYPV